jgi:putative transcriptional regulator
VTRRRADAQVSDGEEPAGQDETAAIRLHLDELLSQRGMTLTELSARVGITVVNLSILKNGRARAIRFSTLARLCEALGCQPGELLSYQPRPPSHTDTLPAGHQTGAPTQAVGARPA